MIVRRGERVKIVYDWKISAEKSLLKTFSFLFKPILSANHHWAMARGQESLIIEMRRRHADGNVPESSVLLSPPATPSQPLQWRAYIPGLRRSRQQTSSFHNGAVVEPPHKNI